MSTFSVRLLDPNTSFTYYDHTEEQAGDVPHAVTGEWTTHDLADLDRVISMLDTVGHQYEVRGLVQVPDPDNFLGYKWSVQPRARKATSPQQLHDDAMAVLVERTAAEQAAYDEAQAALAAAADTQEDDA